MCGMLRYRFCARLTSTASGPERGPRTHRSQSETVLKYIVDDKTLVGHLGPSPSLPGASSRPLFPPHCQGHRSILFFFILLFPLSRAEVCGATAFDCKNLDAGAPFAQLTASCGLLKLSLIPQGTLLAWKAGGAEVDGGERGVATKVAKRREGRHVGRNSKSNAEEESANEDFGA